jgi:Phytanoyl-CoA dioxygenase (PhyH)
MFLGIAEGATSGTTVDSGGVWEQIDALVEQNRRSPDRELERRLMRLRYEAGLELCRRESGKPADPDPDFAALEGSGPLPEITPDQLTPEVARAGILGHGALLVRGLVEQADVARLRDEMDRAYQARAAIIDGEQPESGYYEEFSPDPAGAPVQGRGFVKDAGVFAGDSPRMMFEMLDTFDRAGLRRIAREYLGEPPAVSLQKCTLRRAKPDRGHHIPGWHQDGAFLGDVRALNVWLSLSHCGDDAPGMDLVPRRLDNIVPTGTEGAVFDWVVSPAMAEQAAGDLPIIRPIFEAGDVMLFDELYLHATATDPSMDKVRYAIECGFFGPSAFPDDVHGHPYVPLAA